MSLGHGLSRESNPSLGHKSGRVAQWKSAVVRWPSGLRRYGQVAWLNGRALWLALLTWQDLNLQQVKVDTEGFEPATSGLWAHRADHCATHVGSVSVRLLTWEDSNLQQVKGDTEGFEPATSGLWAHRADHCATHVGSASGC